MTVCMLRLPSKREVTEVTEILSSKDLLRNLRKASVHLGGLSVMKGTTDKARVVYCGVDDYTVLDDLSMAIRTKLRESRVVSFEDVSTKVTTRLQYCDSGIVRL